MLCWAVNGLPVITIDLVTVNVTATVTATATVTTIITTIVTVTILMSGVCCMQELLQAGPHGINQAVAQLLEGVEQKKRDGLGRTLSMARLSSRNSQGLNLLANLSHSDQP